MTTYRAVPAERLGPGAQALAEAPQRVRENCAAGIGLLGHEELLLVLDDTVLGSGSAGLAVTSVRIEIFGDGRTTEQFWYRDMCDVRRDRDDGGGPAVRFFFRDGSSRAVSGQLLADAIDLVIAAASARLPSDSERYRRTQERPWRCPKCSGPESVHLRRIRYRGTYDDVRYALSAVGLSGGTNDRGQKHFFHAYVCRSCGFTELYTEDPGSISADDIPGGEIVRAPDQGPYR